MKTVNYTMSDLVHLSSHPVTTLSLSTFNQWFFSLCLANEEDINDRVLQNEDMIRSYAYLFEKYQEKEWLKTTKLKPLYDLVNHQVRYNEGIPDEKINDIYLGLERASKFTFKRASVDCLVNDIYDIFSHRSDQNIRYDILSKMSYEERIALLHYADRYGCSISFLLPIYVSLSTLYLSDVAILDLATFDQMVTIRTEDIPNVSDDLLMRFYRLELQDDEDILKISLKHQNLVLHLMKDIYDVDLLSRLRQLCVDNGAKDIVDHIDERFIRKSKSNKNFEDWDVMFPWFSTVNNLELLTSNDRKYKKALCYYLRHHFKEKMDILRNLGLMKDTDKDVLGYYHDISGIKPELSILE